MSDSPSIVHSGQARAIEEGLLSPCCWTQTLDIHDSDIASQLRREIEQRVAQHQSPTQIRAVLIARFGQNIVAVPQTSPLPWVAPSVVTVLALVAVVIVLKARSWLRAARLEQKETRSEPDSAVQGYEEALTRELRALDS